MLQINLYQNPLQIKRSVALLFVFLKLCYNSMDILFYISEHKKHFTTINCLWVAFNNQHPHSWVCCLSIIYNSPLDNLLSSRCFIQQLPSAPAYKIKLFLVHTAMEKKIIMRRKGEGYALLVLDSINFFLKNVYGYFIATVNPPYPTLHKIGQCRNSFATQKAMCSVSLTSHPICKLLPPL